MTILLLVVLNLGLDATARGYREVWNGSISDLGWYGEQTPERQENGHGTGYGGSGFRGPPPPQGVSYTYPNVQAFNGSQPVYQMPGHSVVITNGPAGTHSEFCNLV